MKCWDYENVRCNLYSSLLYDSLRGNEEKIMCRKLLTSDAGIAIGPILFIIAILAILAAAIAAGSGSFTAGTTNESNSTKASTLIQIGDNLKVGMDRIMIENSVAFGSVIINANNTVNNVDLFSPIGGGITVPSVTMANNPASDVWLYPTGAVPNIGTLNSEQLAVMRVASGVCTIINNKTDAVSATPGGVDLGNFSATGSDIPTANMNSWPTSLQGRPSGCVNNVNTTTTGTYFYQVLTVR